MRAVRLLLLLPLVVIARRSECGVGSIDQPVEARNLRALSFNPIRTVLPVFVDGTDSRVAYISTRILIDQLWGDGASIRSYFREQSNGQLDFPVPETPEVVRINISLPFVARPCLDVFNDYTGPIVDHLREIGYEPDNYDHLLMYFPKEIDCRYAGYANIGPRSQRRHNIWMLDGRFSVLVHEVGHNIGFQHASTDDDDDGVVESVYGDWSDPMGNFFEVDGLNGPHLLESGWTADLFETDPANLTFLAPIEEREPGSVLIVPRDDETSYFISYRGESARWIVYRHRLLIHYHRTEYRWAQSTRLVAVLEPGQNFSRPELNLTITFPETVDGRAVVTINGDYQLPGESDDGSSGYPLVLIAIGAIIGLLLLAGVIAWLSTRSTPKPTVGGRVEPV